MGGSSVSDDWEFIANGARTLLLVGHTGDGRSATGNSILGRKAFRSVPSFSGVTRNCELRSTRLEDGQILDVIDTPGFDFTAKSELVGHELVRCIELADDGIHAVLLVLSIRTHFSKEEQAAIQYFREFFGNNISDYMIVVFTGGDELEDNETLNDHLERSCPEPLKEVLKMCGNRQVLFDNKTIDPIKKANQLMELLFHVNVVVQKNGGKPCSNDLFKEVKKVKLHNDTLEVNSLLGDIKQDVRELKEQLQRWSHEKQRIIGMVESKLKETRYSLEKQLKEKRARLEAGKNAESEIREIRDSLEKALRVNEALKDGSSSYSCCKCQNHLSSEDCVISKSFQASSGQAFLFTHVTNIVVGTKADKRFITGLHTVADIHCENCNEVLGWKYEHAFEPAQKYKEGKFILERSKIVKGNDGLEPMSF